MQFTYTFSNILTETGTVTRLRPIDFLYDCVEDPFVPCCDCFPQDGQIMYFIDGDVFTYRLNFSPDSLTVYNFDGTVIGDYSSWINDKTIVVNVDDLPLNVDCFYYNITYREEQFCFDFGFRRHGTKELDFCYGGDCGIGTITIESFYTSRDCKGNSYDDVTPYSNKRRFLAEVEFIGNVEEATLSDNTRVSSKVYNQFQVRILQPLKQNSLLLSELVEVIMRGSKLTITIDNGFPYSEIVCVDFTDSLVRSYDNQRDWYPVFTVRKLECDTILNC